MSTVVIVVVDVVLLVERRHKRLSLSRSPFKKEDGGLKNPEELYP